MLDHCVYINCEYKLIEINVCQLPVTIFVYLLVQQAIATFICKDTTRMKFTTIIFSWISGKFCENYICRDMYNHYRMVFKNGNTLVVKGFQHDILDQRTF